MVPYQLKSIIVCVTACIASCGNMLREVGVTAHCHSLQLLIIQAQEALSTQQHFATFKAPMMYRQKACLACYAFQLHFHTAVQKNRPPSL